MDEVSDLKKKYKRILSVTYAGKEYYFRALSVKEHSDIIEIVKSTVDAEEEIVLTASLLDDPNSLLDMPAGFFSNLADAILEFSYLTNIPVMRQALEEKRQDVDNVLNQFKALILAAMPVYTVEELDSKTLDELMYYTVLAERIITIRQEINGVPETGINIQPYSFEEIEEMNQNKAQKYNKNKAPGEATYDDPIAKKLLGG